MALINCPECNREVSDKAEVCPNCGFGVAKYIERQKKILKIQEEAEKEAYLYVKQRKKEEKEKAEQKKKDEINRKNNIYEEAVEKFASESSKDVEKAEELFKTISSWKESEEYLIKCADRISELKRRETMQEERCRRRNKKIILTTVIVGAIIGLTIGGYSFYKMVVVPKNIYESAMRNIQNGDYEEGIEKLETIIDYKDVVQQIENASEGIYERDYNNAKEFIAKQEYEQALEILKRLGSNEEIDGLIAECEYEQGIDLIEAKKYKEAINLLINNDIDNNEEKLKECYMELACQEIINGAYDSALEYFMLADYKGEKYLDIYYEKGITAYEDLDYISAITYFKECVGYKDSAEILGEIRRLVDGYWYRPRTDVEGGRVIAIDTSKQSCKLWTGWDYSYTLEYVKENQEEFDRYFINPSRGKTVISNGNGTYSVLFKVKDGNEIRLLTFEINGNFLEVISVYYPTWEDAIGIYSRIE